MFILSHEYAVYLHGGYQYFGSSGDIVINRSALSDKELADLNKKIDKGLYDNDPDLGRPHVGPNVDSYRVYSDIITGHVSPVIVKKGDPVYDDYYDERRTKQGYFIIDLHTNRLSNGLSKKEWRSRLRKYGINDEPKLFKPCVSKWEEYFEHNKPHPQPE